MNPDESVEKEIDATPDKRMLYSITRDIDIETAILELVDNAIDNSYANKTARLRVDVEITQDQIKIKDNSGGINENDLKLLLQPGGTTRFQTDGLFGIFGMGAKRAIFAISSDITIKSRIRGNDGYEIHIPEDWISNKSWKLKASKNNEIEEGTTEIILKSLSQKPLNEELVELKNLLGETYARIIDENRKIFFNDIEIRPILKINWAAAESYPPKRFKFSIPYKNSELKVALTIGFTAESSQIGNYGFDLVSNGRLVKKYIHDSRLGFETNLLGKPHTYLSWFKGIIEIDGPARLMPWDSMKHDLDIKIPIYRDLLRFIVKASKPYIKFLRKRSGTTKQYLIPVGEERIEEIQVEDFHHPPVFDYLKISKRPTKEGMKRISFNYDATKFESICKALNLDASQVSSAATEIFDFVLHEVGGFD